MFLIVTLYGVTININQEYGFIEMKEYVFHFSIIFMALCLAVCSAITDAPLKIYNHASRYIFRGIVLSIFPLINSLFNTYDILFIEQFWLGATTFYLLFDYLYNLEKGIDIEYVGQTSIHDKVLRIVFGGKYQTLYIALFKILLFISGIYVTFIL